MKWKSIIYLLAAGGILFSGCSKEAGPPRYAAPDQDPNGNPYQEEYNAVVTVKQTTSGTIYFQVDEKSRLYPVNYEEPYTGPKRLACLISDFGGMVDGNVNWHYGMVVWSEEVEEGPIYPRDESFPADDGLNVLDDWMTSLEDAFLTIHYSTFWGDGSTAHQLLLMEGNQEGEFLLLHYRNGDEALTEADALICFDLNDRLPKTEGMDIKLKWTTGAGESAEKSFRFRSRP